MAYFSNGREMNLVFFPSFLLFYIQYPDPLIVSLLIVGLIFSRQMAGSVIALAVGLFIFIKRRLAS